MDSWLPDLEVGEFAGQVRMMYPAMEMLRVDGGVDGGARSPRRNELLHALREAQDAPLNDTAAWKAAPVAVPARSGAIGASVVKDVRPGGGAASAFGSVGARGDVCGARVRPANALQDSVMLPEMVGASEPMRELARLIRLVAPRSTTVLIEGETGTGKEVVARALHRLSERAGKPFAVLNCAAIPEALLEAELFGHTRGAFTGAVQSRTGQD